MKYLQNTLKKILAMHSLLDVNGFKLASVLFSYGLLEPMVINFICDFYLGCYLPRCLPLRIFH